MLLSSRDGHHVPSLMHMRSFQSIRETGIHGIQASLVQLVGDFVCADVVCSGNPRVLEFWGVDTKTGEVLLSFSLFPKGTNNIGEFLAVVHALQYFLTKIIYTDSVIALARVKNKKISTNLVRDDSTEELWQKLKWLRHNSCTNRVLR